MEPYIIFINITYKAYTLKLHTNTKIYIYLYHHIFISNTKGNKLP